MPGKTARLVLPAVLFALGLLAGAVAMSVIGAPPAPPAPAKGLPPQLAVAGRPVIEDLQTRDFRLVVLSYRNPLRLIRRHCLQGNFDLTVLDRSGNAVYVVSNGEASPDCRADYSEFATKGLLRLVFYTWDVREVNPVAWKVEAIQFRPGDPAAVSARVALKPEEADAKRIAELVARVQAAWKKPAKGADDRTRLDDCEKALNQLRNIGVGRTGEIIKILEGFMQPQKADGALAESISDYLDQLEEIGKIRAARGGRRQRPG